MPHLVGVARRRDLRPSSPYSARCILQKPVTIGRGGTLGCFVAFSWASVIPECPHDAGAASRSVVLGHAVHSSVMKPRIFLGSSGQQEKLLQALTRGLQDIADVEPW